jgi:putative transcriptional regulator
MKKTKHDWTHADAMTDEQVEAAALADPDAQPMTDAQLARKPVARSKTIRRAPGLTQEAFCERYHIALGTLRDWEQGKTEPDQTARAYLKTIATDPEGIARIVSDPRDNRPARAVAPAAPMSRLRSAAKSRG